MKIYNAQIARLFARLADLLEIENANPFRVRAYRNAAAAINNMSQSLVELVAGGADLTELPYIGEDLAAKIKTIIETGELPALIEIEKRLPAALTQLLEIEGIGPKRVQAIYRQLNVTSIDDLKQAIEQGKLRGLHGFSEKLEKKIKASMQHIKEYQQRFKLVDATTIAAPLLSYLRTLEGVTKVEIAGSFRRHKDTVGDLDIVVIAKKSSKVIEKFLQYEEINEVISHGATCSTIRLNSGIQIDLRVIPAISYGSALLYFTGAKTHTVAIRKIAQQKGYKINEYGIYKNNKRITGKSEVEIYHALNLQYIEPELRENTGEILAAANNTLPKLVTLEDIRGDLHCHTDATDGTANLEAMVEAAKQRGYEYIAITDHSQNLTVANGLNEARLLAQIKLIDKLNEKLSGIVILKSLEVDILEDGTLDLSDEILSQLDLRICSIHTRFGLSREQQTERIIRAMDNKYFNILTHPTGRLIGKREPYEIDMEKIMQAAKERNCFLEINSQPDRLDLNETYGKLAKELKLKLAISSDAHSTTGFSYMEFGVYQARRGWLEAEDIVNTRSLGELRKLLKR